VRYDDFDLLIVAAGEGGTYRAQVTGSPGGQCLGRPFTLPFTSEHLELMRLTAGARRGLRASVAAQISDRIVSFGNRLFETVFAGDVLACFNRSIGAARGDDRGLRVRLRIDDPALADLPWEFLHDPEGNRFLCLSERTPLVRFLPLPSPPEPLMVQGSLRVLAVIANPDIDADPLDVETEWAGLQTAVAGPRDSGQLILDRLGDPTLAELRAQLRRHDYHVLHFVGHGRFNIADHCGELLFEDERGRPHAVAAATLAVFLHDHPSLRLAVLNACEGGRANATNPFSGTAQTLIQQGVPAVVAMQFEISDRAAIAFATAFYTAIALGAPLDSATAQGRHGILTRSDVEWATPVIYTRATDTRIFTMPRTAGRHAAPPQPIADRPLTRPSSHNSQLIVPAQITPQLTPSPAMSVDTSAGQPLPPTASDSKAAQEIPPGIPAAGQYPQPLYDANPGPAAPMHNPLGATQYQRAPVSGRGPITVAANPRRAQLSQIQGWIGRIALWVGTLFFVCGTLVFVLIVTGVIRSTDASTSNVGGLLCYSIPLACLVPVVIHDLRRLRRRRRARAT
jgi:hypothetical protein